MKPALFGCERMIASFTAWIMIRKAMNVCRLSGLRISEPVADEVIAYQSDLVEEPEDWD